MVPPPIIFSDSALKFYKVMSIMRVNHYKLLHKYLVIVDLLAMAFSFLLAVSVVVSEVDGIPLTEFLSIRISILNFIIFVGFTFAWYIILALSGAHYVRRLSKKKKEIKNIIQLTSLGTIILLIFKVIFNIKLVTLSFLMVFWLMTTILAISTSPSYQVYHQEILGKRHQSSKCGHYRYQ